MGTSLFAKRLKEAREARELSQETLGRAVGTTRYSVIEWEAGRQVPSAVIAAKVAETMGVSLDFLMGKDELAGEKPMGVLRHYRLFPDGSLIPVEASGNPLQEVLAENPDLEAWFRARKLSEEEKSQIAALDRKSVV